MAETREDFLNWAKQRALEYLDRGELRKAITSLQSDLGKNPKVYDVTSEGAKLAFELGTELRLMRADAAAIRRWIEGFN